MLGNSSGKLGKGWGEVRGRNGIIIAEPTPHENPGGQYTWLVTGLIPVLPAALAELMPDALTSEDAASDTEWRHSPPRHRVTATLASSLSTGSSPVAEGEDSTAPR
jgi:hypothetical protein